MTGDHSDPGSGEGLRSNYAEFRLRFERNPGPGTYQVTASVLGREVERAFELPFSDLELENLVLRLGGARRGARGVDSPQTELAKAFGGKLFEALFESDIRSLYRVSTLESRNTGQGLRIALELTNAPELQRVAWEYLYDRPLFLSTDPRTPIVRYLDLPGPISPLRVQLPLRILAIVSAPTDVPAIDSAQERAKLEAALAPLLASGSVEIEWLEDANLTALFRLLSKQDRSKFHILHFIGHGGYANEANEGLLLFEGKDGRYQNATGDKLGAILHGEESLRLAVLNSCEGARATLNDPFSSVATSLIEHEIPAVIGMQFEITDRAAILFAGEFYAALANGRAVDEALSQARMAIFADHNDIEWGTPVLFMRVTDGRIFDVQAPVAPSGNRRAAAVVPDYDAAGSAVAESDRASSAAAAADLARLAEAAELARDAAEIAAVEAERSAREEQPEEPRGGSPFGQLFRRRRDGRTEGRRSPGPTVAATVVCGHCGSANPAERRFCSRCGVTLAPLSADPLTRTAPPRGSGGILGRLFRGKGPSREARPSTSSDSVAPAAIRIERHTSATFPAEVEAGATARLAFSIGTVLPGGVEGLVYVEAPASATSVELVATVHAPDFEIMSPAPPAGGGAPLVALPLNVVDPSWAVDGEFLLRAKPLAAPREAAILLDFWHRASPVGQIRIETQIVPRGAVVSLEAQRPSVGDFRVSGASPPPADITLFITDEGGGRYQVQATTSKVFMRELGEFPAGQNAWSYSAKVLERFRDAGDLPEGARIDRVVGLGLDLWDNLPAAFHDFYWDELEGRDRSIAIYSQEPYIPWELVRPPTREGRTSGFLGSDFRVARWRNGRLFPDPLAVRDFVVIAPDYADKPLPGTAIEAADLVSRFGARVVDGQYDPVAASLRSQAVQLVHFAGHGSYDEDAPLQSQIRLSDHDLVPTDIRTFRQGLGSGPFVFLNACKVGEQGWALTGIGGWADVFCDVGCAGFIGPYWEVDDEVARLAALRFYDGLASGKPVGEAIRDVRRAFDEPGPFVHHPTWLAYSLHCQPNIRIDLGH